MANLCEFSDMGNFLQFRQDLVAIKVIKYEYKQKNFFHNFFVGPFEWDDPIVRDGMSGTEKKLNHKFATSVTPN